MSLLTPTESVTARIAADAEQLASYLASAIVLANRITGHALSLPTEQLNEWLNARPLDPRLAEFACHGDLGDALNDAATVAEVATGRPEGTLGRVDIRSVAEKLAEQGRSLVVEDGSFLVSQQPQTQQTNDPES
jgi:hypothetical protein